MEVNQLFFIILSPISLGIFLFLWWISFVLIVDDISLAFTIVIYGGLILTPVGAAWSSWYYSTPPTNPGEVVPLHFHSSSVSDAETVTSESIRVSVSDKSRRRSLVLAALVILMFLRLA